MLPVLVVSAAAFLIYGFNAVTRGKVHQGPDIAIAVIDPNASVKHLDWHQTKADCTDDDMLDLGADGTATLNGKGFSKGEAGRTWRETIDVEDDSGKTLFTLGPWESPPLSSDATIWAGDGTFPPRLFSQIAKAVEHGGC